jgi:hypothetical protein
MAKTFIKDDPIARETMALRKEYELFQEKRKRLADKLVEKWNKTKFGKLDKLYSINPTKARNTAIALENAHRELTILKENGIIATTLFNTQPENVLKVVRIGVANRNRGDIFDEYQLLSMYDALYFINRVVGTSDRAVSNLTNPDKLIYEAGINELLEGSEISWGEDNVNFGTLGNAPVEINIPETPIVPYTVKVYIEGIGYVGTDDGNGRFVSQPLSITSGEKTSYLDTEKSEVDYKTGNVKLYFNGVTGQHKVIVEGNYNSELREGREKFQKISLRIEKRNWRPRPYPIQWEFSQMLTLFFRNPQFGNVGDVSDMLIKAAGDEHAIRADLRALQEAKRVAELNPKYKFDANYTGKSDNDFNHAQRIYTVIQNIVGQIYNELGRGGVVSIVATPTVANYLAKHHKFNEDTTQPRVSGTFLYGTIGSIKIYQTRADRTQGILKEEFEPGKGINGECLIICKNMEDVGEPSIAWGVLAELSAALDYPELYRSGVLATVEDRIIVQPKFIRKLSVEHIQDLEVT